MTHETAEWHYENPNCHYGDHDFASNGHCDHCDTFNGAWLRWMATEKAEREGRHHGDHYHLTAEKAGACPRPDHPAGPCSETGGCLHHEATEAWLLTVAHEVAV